MHSDDTTPDNNVNPREAKRCCTCKQEMPLSDFHKDKRRQDGHKGTCKQCLQLLKKQYRQENKEKLAEYYRLYYQANKDKLIECHLRYAQANKDKVAEYSRRYYQKNKEKIEKTKRKYELANKEEIARKKREYEIANRDRFAERRSRSRQRRDQAHKVELVERGRRWRQENPDKVREYKRNRRARKRGNGGRVTANEWESVLDRFNGKCAKCGSAENIHMDHVVPLAKGGRHSVDNVQPLCATCNMRKHTKTEDYRGKMYRPLALPLDEDVA